MLNFHSNLNSFAAAAVVVVAAAVAVVCVDLCLLVRLRELGLI